MKSITLSVLDALESRTGSDVPNNPRAKLSIEKMFEWPLNRNGQWAGKEIGKDRELIKIGISTAIRLRYFASCQRAVTWGYENK